MAAFLFLGAASGGGTAFAAADRWAPTGPPTNVYALSTDPVVSGVVYASGAEGIWRSADHADAMPGPMDLGGILLRFHPRFPAAATAGGHGRL